MRVSTALVFFLLSVTLAQARITSPPPCHPSITCAMQSVVSVLPQWPKDTRRNTEPEGSGVAVHDGSLIATSDHVLGPATKVRIRTLDGQIAEAKIVFRDKQTDIALLKIDGKLPRLVDSITKTGFPKPPEKVCAIGNAFGLDISVTCGVISAVDVTGTGFNQIEDFIQTDAAVNPGMSGGALIDEYGGLVGMLSAIFTKNSDSNIGVNFAISRQLLYRVIYDHLDNGRLNRPTPGILIKPTKNGIGGQIVRLAAGSPEANAGLQVGDILTRINDRRVSRPGLYRRALAFAGPGKPIDVTVTRDEREFSLTIEFN